MAVRLCCFVLDGFRENVDCCGRSHLCNRQTRDLQIEWSVTDVIEIHAAVAFHGLILCVVLAVNGTFDIEAVQDIK